MISHSPDKGLGVAAQRVCAVKDPKHVFIPLTLLITSLASLFVAFVTGAIGLGNLFVPLVLTGIVALMVLRPGLWVILACAGLPFVFYVRQWFPGTIGIGGAAFVASGALKEFLALSVLIAAFLAVRQKLSFAYLSYPLLFYLVLLALGAMRSNSIIEGVAYLRIYVLSLVFYIAALLDSSESWASRIATLLIILGIVDASLGLYRYFVDEKFLITNVEVISDTYLAYENGVYRLNGLSQVNTTATLLALGLFSTLYFRDRKPWLRALWLPIVVLFLFALALTQSRTGLLILFVALIFWLVMQQLRARRFEITLLTAIVIMGAAVGAVFYITRVMQVDVLSRLLDLSLTSEEGRGYYWQMLLNSLNGGEWLVGKGLSVIGSFGLQVLDDSLGTTADNFYLQLLVTIGMFGLVAFLSFAALVLIIGARRLRSDIDGSNNGRHSLEYLLGLVGLILIASATGVSILEPYIGALFWLATGAITIAYLKSNKSILRASLGSVDISSKPDQNARKVKEAEQALVQLFKS